MDCDRRTLLLAALVTMLAPGCARAAPPATTWAAIEARYLLPEGRLVDSGNGNISHSEGQGYAMLLAEAAGDRDGFDRLWGWTDRTLARKDVRLFAWKYDPAAKPPVSDANNASDGDILIAWALLRASARWKAAPYRKASDEIRAAIRQRLIWKVADRTILLPGLDGFVSADATTLNLSYYVWPALDAFRRTDGAAAWGALIADGEKLTAQAQFGPSRLPPDWIEIGANGLVAPARQRPPRFGFDAIRVPLYLVWSGRTSLTAPFRAFWQDYSKRNAPTPAWIDVVTGEVAPYPLSRGAMAVRDMLLRDKAAIPAGPPENYYADVLGALVAVARR